MYLQVKDRPCAVFPSDQRVTVPAEDLYSYPDVTIVCGDAEFEDQREETLLNPTVIFEVLSKSTEAYDRGVKFEYYRTVASLKEYILVAADKPHVEHYLCQPNGTWVLSEFKRLDETVPLPSIGCTLEMKDVYLKVKL